MTATTTRTMMMMITMMITMMMMMMMMMIRGFPDLDIAHRLIAMQTLWLLLQSRALKSFPVII